MPSAQPIPRDLPVSGLHYVVQASHDRSCARRGSFMALHRKYRPWQWQEPARWTWEHFADGWCPPPPPAA